VRNLFMVGFLPILRLGVRLLRSQAQPSQHIGKSMFARAWSHRGQRTRVELAQLDQSRFGNTEDEYLVDHPNQVEGTARIEWKPSDKLHRAEGMTNTQAPRPVQDENGKRDHRCQGDEALDHVGRYRRHGRLRLHEPRAVSRHVLVGHCSKRASRFHRQQIFWSRGRKHRGPRRMEAKRKAKT
jgi:hypothetical protein